METKVKRRYGIANKAEYKIYSEAFDLLLKQSNILNSGDHQLNAHSILWDKNAVENHLYELEGDNKGLIHSDFSTQTVPAAIPVAKEVLKALAKKWEKHKEQKVAQGFEEPTKEPSDMFEARLRAEARLDVLKREAEKLKEWLAKAEVKQVEIANEKMLQYGPLGQGRLFNGALVELDYQSVKKHGDILIISEPASPFLGMKISDYRKYVCEPWCTERHAKRRAVEKLFNKEMAETGHSNIVIPPGLGLRKVDRTSLPKWPEGVKNHLESEK